MNETFRRFLDGEIDPLEGIMNVAEEEDSGSGSIRRFLGEVIVDVVNDRVHIVGTVGSTRTVE